MSSTWSWCLADPRRSVAIGTLSAGVANSDVWGGSLDAGAVIIPFVPSEIVRASVWQEDDRWRGHLDGSTKAVSASSKESCLAALRRAAGTGKHLTVEVTPGLAGVAEAARIMGWDKRRVVTYLNRGSFPRPLASLASGRIWRRDDIEAFAKAWHKQHAKRKAR